MVIHVVEEPEYLFLTNDMATVDILVEEIEIRDRGYTRGNPSSKCNLSGC